MQVMVEQVGKTFSVSFPDSGAHIGFSRITDQRNGDYRGWVSLCDGDVLLHSSAINLCTASARQTLVKSLNNSLPWASMLDTACLEVAKRLMAGSPAEVIRSEDDVQPERHLVEPFLPLGEPTLVYGRGGSCKSYLALPLGVFVQLPWPENPFGWKVGQKSVNVLYCDWETSKDVIHRRLKRLLRGMGLPEALHMTYRQCQGTLVSELEAIERIVMDQKIGFVVIDSAGRACGGDLNAPAPVNEFYTAIRQLGVTVLIVHHTSKDEFMKQKTPFGSSYFENNARSQWHIEREREGNETDFAVSLSHTKVNDSAKHRPLGLRVRFDNTPGQESTAFELCDLQETEFTRKLPLRERIERLLQNGPLQPSEIAGELGEKEDVVRARLSDGKKHGHFQNDGHFWSLKE
jgi:AAA domain